MYHLLGCHGHADPFSNPPRAQVINAGETGAARHPLFPLHPLALHLVADRTSPAGRLLGLDLLEGGEVGGGGGGSGAKVAPEGVAPAGGEGEGDEPADVRAEAAGVAGDESLAIRLLGLRKVYKAARGSGGGLKVAVHGLSLGVNRRECFGLLGHNGAGKSTAISILCGLQPPTAGTATVLGHDILVEMAKIHGTMGVCPQHDALWMDLTAREHLLFYGRLRRLRGNMLERGVRIGLSSVALLEWSDVRAEKFSGGMRRRLSMATALIGGPSVVYLDEPTTGLDVAVRRRLWDVVAEAKRDKAIVLTTHAMEEADVLCDRIGIMGEGKLRCVGPSSDLKRRFGAGFKLSIRTTDESDEMIATIKTFIVNKWPSATAPNAAMGGSHEYEIDDREVVLSDCFSTIQGQRAAWGVQDWGITETTLEEVFQRVSKGTYDKDTTRVDKKIATGAVQPAVEA